MKKVVLFADASCDLPRELVEKYEVNYIYGGIELEGEFYTDSVTITPEELFDAYRERKVLPKTSAVNTEIYLDAFAPWLDKGYEVVMVSLSSEISACHQNSLAAAEERQGIYPVDSKNLSTGIGHLVIEAARLIRQGLPAEEVARAVCAMTEKVHTSFVLDTLEYMRAGGRCSAVAAFGANLLGLKPRIEMDKNGRLQATKKYRGALMRVLPEYIKDQLTGYDDIRTDKIFITYSTTTPEILELVRAEVNKVMPFENVYESRASCTISSHCGPGTLGILFMTR